MTRTDHPHQSKQLGPRGFLLEQYALSDSLMLADALIAATALETGFPLLTGNDKHYRAIEGVEITTFRP